MRPAPHLLPRITKPELTQNAAESDGLGESDLFRLLAENVVDYAIFVIGSGRSVRTWSPAAEHLLGYSAQEIVGRSSDVFFTPEDLKSGQPEREVREALERSRGEDDRWHVRRDERGLSL